MVKVPECEFSYINFLAYSSYMHVIGTLVTSIEVFFLGLCANYVVSYNIMHYLKIALMTFATKYIMKFDC